MKFPTTIQRPERCRTGRSMPRERAQGGGALFCAGRVAADGLRAAHVLLRRRGQRQLEPVHGVAHQPGKASRRDSGSISFWRADMLLKYK